HGEWQAQLQEDLGDCYAMRGDHVMALRRYERAADQVRPFDDGAALNVLQKIGGLYEAQGDLTNARRCFEESSASAARGGYKWLEAFGLRRLGEVYRDSGEYF